jgi:hypothetical protein
MNAFEKLFLVNLLSFVITSSCMQRLSLPTHFEQQGKIEVCLFTELIFKRFYYIVRLDEPISLINAIKEAKKNMPVNLEFVTDIDSLTIFNHQRIIDALTKMKKTKNLGPILGLWEDFNTYKFLDDETFLDDFTKLILIISKKLVLCIVAQQCSRSFINSIYSFYDKGLSATTQERLEYIDMLIIEFMNIKNNKKHTKLQTIKSSHIVPNFTEAVSDRMYYIKRLQNALDYLSRLPGTNTMFFNHIESTRVIFDGTLHFYHERINECIELMELEKNADSMFLLWDEFIHYKYLNDELFLEELIKIIFVSFKNLTVNINGSKQEKAFQQTLQELLQFYERLDSIPLEEILNAIDILAHELPKISQKYELNSNMSWREWLRKYWWSPPLIAGTIAIKVLIIYQYLMHKKPPTENSQGKPA